jgi:uncharacterized protein YndB with AHSA1/START domain
MSLDRLDLDHAATVRRELVLPVSAEELWDALTAPEAVRDWFGADVAWDLTPGGYGRFQEDDGSLREARVDTVDRGRRLAFRWWPAGREDEASDVDYVLVEEDAGTRLVVTESRPGSGPDAAVPTTAQLRADATWSVWDHRMVGLWCRSGRSAAFVRG